MPPRSTGWGFGRFWSANQLIIFALSNIKRLFNWATITLCVLFNSRREFCARSSRREDAICLCVVRLFVLSYLGYYLWWWWWRWGGEEAAAAATAYGDNWQLWRELRDRSATKDGWHTCDSAKYITLSKRSHIFKKRSTSSSPSS